MGVAKYHQAHDFLDDLHTLEHIKQTGAAANSRRPCGVKPMMQSWRLLERLQKRVIPEVSLLNVSAWIDGHVSGADLHTS